MFWTIEADTSVNAPDILDSTVFKSVAIDEDVAVNAPDTLDSTLSMLPCNALDDAFKLADTSVGVATPVPPVKVIEPSTERSLPSQTSLSPKLNLLPLST